MEGARDCKEGGGNHFRLRKGLKHRKDKALNDQNLGAGPGRGLCRKHGQRDMLQKKAGAITLHSVDFKVRPWNGQDEIHF